MLYLNQDLYHSYEDGSLAWRPVFLACLRKAINETPRPGYPPSCLHRVAQAILKMDDPIRRAEEYVLQAGYDAQMGEASEVAVLARAVLRYGGMHTPNWQQAIR